MGQCEPDFGKNTINVMYFQQFFFIIFFYSYHAVILAWVLQELTKKNVRIDDCKNSMHARDLLIQCLLMKSRKAPC